MIEYTQKENYNISDLLEIIRLLRAPGGCPWDREQDHRSIRTDFLEETYEVLDAIDRNDLAGIREELGDVLLQVLFHTVIEEEKGSFTLDDVADGICKKLIYRHPHVFGDGKADTSEQVLDNWDRLKKAEKSQKSQTDAMNSVPRNFPALIRSAKLQKKARKGGMDLGSFSENIASLKEAVTQLEQAEALPADAREKCVGELLTYAVRCAGHLQVDCEQSLTAESNALIDRFSAWEVQQDK